MENLRFEINDKYAVFYAEMTKAMDGNKAAGVRARKASLELAKLLKQYRKESIETAKK